MILHNSTYRARAALALHSLVGGPASQRVIMKAPVAIEVPGSRLLIVAGDHERPLAPSALRPLATDTGWAVLATWVDPMLSGHKVIIDAVVIDAGKPRVLTERVLLQTKGGATFLVDEAGVEPALAVDVNGIRFAQFRPWRDKTERVLGIARGQALLQRRIYAGSPYATPLPRNIGR